MNVLRNNFQWLFLAGSRKVILNFFDLSASDKTAASQRRFAAAYTKSGELTQEELAEVLGWLSLY